MSIFLNLLGGGKGRLLFNKYSIFVGDEEKVLDVESGDGYTTLRTHLMPLNCTFTKG